MTRMNLVAIAGLAGAFFGLQPAQAYEAPWCAVIQLGPGAIYEDCQYRSFEDCYRRGNILAGNRGSCNPSQYYVANAAEYTRAAKRRARPQWQHGRVVNVRYWHKADMPSCTAYVRFRGKADMAPASQNVRL